MGGSSGKNLTQDQGETPAGENQGILGTQEQALGDSWGSLLFLSGDNTGSPLSSFAK